MQYKEIFAGIGTFPGKPYHINTDLSIPPKWLPCPPVPVHQQDEFKKQLNEMLDAGVITEVHETTPCINSFVIVETVKDGKKKLRICLDPKPLNKAIMLSHTSHVHLMMSITSWQMPSTSQLLTLRSHFGNLSWMRKAVLNNSQHPIWTLSLP